MTTAPEAPLAPMTEQHQQPRHPGTLRGSATIDATAAASRPWLPDGRGPRRSAFDAGIESNAEERALAVTDDDAQRRSIDFAAAR